MEKNTAQKYNDETTSKIPLEKLVRNLVKTVMRHSNAINHEQFTIEDNKIFIDSTVCRMLIRFSEKYFDILAAMKTIETAGGEYTEI